MDLVPEVKIIVHRDGERLEIEPEAETAVEEAPVPAPAGETAEA